MEKWMKKAIIAGVIALVVLVVGINSCSVIDPTEESVVVRLGKVQVETLSPGLHFKTPFIDSFRKIDKSPIEYKKAIPLGEKALITKDGQSLGIDFTMTWKYQDGSVVTVAKNYSTKDALYNLISNPCKQAFKSEIGKLEALEFVGKQDEVIAAVIQKVATESKRLNLPIEVLNLVVENINWDTGFETQIKKTAEMRAQVEQANQDALKEAANAQKKVAVAKAEADAKQAEADAKLYVAQKEAEAKKAEGEGIAAYNRAVAQNQALEIKLKELEIQKIHEEKWDGHLVPNYVPLTAAGGIVSLSAK